MNIDTLFQTAAEARMQAYAPYSNFKVGAALRGSEWRGVRRL